MRQYSDEFKREAIKLYQQGLSCRKIGIILDRNHKTVSKWLKQSGFTLDVYPKRVPEFKKAAIDFYLAGLGAPAIATKLNCNVGSIYRWLKNANINSRPCQKYTLDESYFKELNSEEKCYWQGFLMADGYVNPTKNLVMLALQNRDKRHLEKFRNSLSASHPIPLLKNGCCEIRIYSKKLCHDSSLLGLAPPKSIKIALTNIPAQFQADFFRGLFDGDGCISRRRNENTYVISLAGTKTIVATFSIWLGYGGKYVSKHSSANCYYFCRSRQSDIARVLYRLYHDAHIYLDRKYELAMKVLSELGYERQLQFPFYPH